MSALGTHAGQLERWLGKQIVEDISVSMANWYGPPIALAGVPGKVYAHSGGDFRGEIRAGKAASAMDALSSFGRRLKGAARRTAYKQQNQANTGFASLSDLISEMTVGGKKQELPFQKAGPTRVVGAAMQLWQLGNWPPVGAIGAAAPGGTPHTDATTGGMPFNNPTGPDTTHYIGGGISASTVSTYLLYDRLFSVNKTMNSTATEAVTGVPTRYTGTTPGAQGSSEGNFMFPVTGLTVLAATAHNWTVCQYTDHQGNATQSAPSIAGNSANAVHRLDLPTGQWFMPLATGDTGLTRITQMQCSAAVATGLIEFVMGHPIAWMPVPLVNVMCMFDGINTAANLERIFDDACLSFLEVGCAATTATNMQGSITIVSG